MNNNQLNVQEKQRFKATVLNSTGNPIKDISKYTITWTIVDENNRPFTSFTTNMLNLFIN